MCTCIGDITMMDMAYMIISDGRITEVNQLFQKLTGYNEQDILGREIGEVWRKQLRITADNNSVKCGKEFNCYIFDKNRTVKEVIIKYSEIPEPEQGIYTFQLIRNSMFEEKYPFLEQINSSNDTVVALCSIPDFVLLKANDSFFKFFGKGYSELPDILGLPIEETIPSWENSEMKDVCVKAVETGKSVFFNEKHIEFPGIIECYARVTLTPIIEAGQVRYLVLIHNDVTEKVMNREAVAEKSGIIEEQKKRLETQRDYLYKLFNSLELPILYLSYPELRVIEINKKALSVLNEIMGMENTITESQLLGRCVSDFAPTINDLGGLVFLEKMAHTRSMVCHDKMEIIRNGHKIYYSVTYQPIFDIKGEICEVLVAAVDVTDETERRNHMEDILKMKDEFIYLISHEFKTPLTVINAAVQSLEYIYASQIPDKARTLITKIKQNSFRQLRLVNNLLDIARINAGRIKLRERNIDIEYLTKAITESVALFAQQKGVEIIFTSKLSGRVIGIDDEKFERILLNLLSNAIKFTPAGKKVFVEVSAKLHNKRRMVCIKVKDQGVGIPEEKQGIIFERFGQVDSLITRQGEGTGIGLFLVKLMVNALDGDIYLKSKEGKGSTFTLMIPSKKVIENTGQNNTHEISDSRLVQSIATEFSDVY